MVESFLRRSIEILKASELLFEQEIYNASANRAYYASFHAAIVAIYTAGIIPTIDHKIVRSLFSDYYFNKRKIFPSKYNDYLRELQDKRSIADYKNGISKKDAKHQLKMSKDLVEVILSTIK